MKENNHISFTTSKPVGPSRRNSINKSEKVMKTSKARERAMRHSIMIKKIYFRIFKKNLL